MCRKGHDSLIFLCFLTVQGLVEIKYRDAAVFACFIAGFPLSIKLKVRPVYSLFLAEYSGGGYPRLRLSG